MGERAEKAAGRARRNATGCRKRSEAHAISFHRWNKYARLLAVATAALAGLGGIGAISSAQTGSTWAILGGALVVLTVLARAVDEGLGAKRTAEEHRLAAVRFRELQLAYIMLGQFPPDDDAAAEEKLAQLQAQAVQAEADSPLEEKRSKEMRERQEENA